MIEGGKRVQNILKNSSSEKPLVSIITVVLNGEKYLEHTINSVLKQTYDAIEYIIIDGGSTDSSIRIIEKYEHEIDYWCSRSDNGISDAFNIGIDKTTGELIGIINSDDWYENNAVEQAVNAFKRTNSQVICGAINFWADNKKIITSLSDVGKIRRETSIHHSTTFISKNIYDKYGKYDVSYKYAMDYELLLRLATKNIVIYSLKDVIANRRLEGTSYKNRKEALKETKRARANYFSPVNVCLNYLFIVIKDYMGRIAKDGKLLWLYRFYWQIKNSKLSKGGI
jgi:glycosyltransferase involved in cell wall biosynthesis